VTEEEREQGGEEPREEQRAEEPAEAGEQPAEGAEQPAGDQGAEEPTEAGDQPAEGEPEAAAEAERAVEAEDEAVQEGEPAEAPQERARPRPGARRRGDDDEPAAPEHIPGADLEPDLVLEETEPGAEVEFGEYAEAFEGAPEAAVEAPPSEEEEAPAAPGEEPAPAPRSIRDLAADARYQATGKRKRSVARVIVRPGEGAYTVNGRALDEYFARPALRKAARQPLEAIGFEGRMDIVANIHGGGVSAQAGALRHGVARALVEADPNLRTELKRRGFLTRDARAKERKKAGLKKARKRPQFSKR
jgi:small subunit ribosomal protein S9